MIECLRLFNIANRSRRRHQTCLPESPSDTVRAVRTSGMKNVISSLCRGRFVNEQDNSRVIVHRNLQKLGLDTWDTAVVRLGYQTDQGRA